MRLQGKRALVTAAGQGIGRACAEAMMREGAQVFATDINMETLGTLEGAETFAMDARDPAQIAAAAERAQPDILVNCAGFVHNGTILEATEDEWDFAFDLNVKSMVRTIRRCRLLTSARVSMAFSSTRSWAFRSRSAMRAAQFSRVAVLPTVVFAHP